MPGRCCRSPFVAVSLLAPAVLGAQAQHTDSPGRAGAGSGALQAIHASVLPPEVAPPTIDGRLDEALWQQVLPVSDFWKMRPVDNEPASTRTEVFVSYDRHSLYVAFHCYQDSASVRASLATRDNIFADDVVGVFLDTFHDHRHGYLLFVNPLGIQADGITAVGADDDYSIDLVWTSAGRRTADGYVVELAIPFRSLRFANQAVQTWGIAFPRLVPSKTEQDIYPRVDVDNNCLLCQTAELVGLTGIKPGRTVELLPAVTGRQGGARGDYDAPFRAGATLVDVGVGVKYGLTSNLTLDATANPDFSQVEADAGQVEVNQRFALFFPEKRPFFLEGTDIFATPLQLVYTRQIFDPLAAAKLTGKIGGTSVGILTALDQTPLLPRGDALPAGGSMPAEDAVFNVVRMKQDVGRSSSIGLLTTDREFAGSWNRVAGLDAQVGFLDLWRVTAQAVYSDTRSLDGTRPAGPAYALDVSRNGPHLLLELFYNDVAPGFRADAGFIRRTDVREGGVFIAHQVRPNGATVLQWRPGLLYDRLYDHAGVLQDERIVPQLQLRLVRQTFVQLRYIAHRERFADRDFRKSRWQLVAETAPSRLLSGGGFVEQGDEINFDPDSAYLGWSRDLSVWGTLRPSDAVSADLSLVKSTFWRRAGGPRVFDVNIWRAKLAYQFSKQLFLRLITEWNTYDCAVSLNPLLSYTARPGTVFFLGMDNGLESAAGRPLKTMHRTVFFKASYLWRL